MKTKDKDIKIANKYTRKEMKEIINDENKLDFLNELIKSGLSSKEIKTIHNLIRESRIDLLFKELNVNYDEYVHAKNKIIKLKPKSEELHLISVIFRDCNGNYKIEDLLNKYHDAILHDGINYGMDYGVKFLYEDIQNGKYTIDDFKNMTEEDIDNYGRLEREEI